MRYRATHLPMLALVVALVVSADPVVAVTPFRVSGGADPRLGPAFATVVEADLKAAGLSVRTEDDLRSENWGKIKGASFLVVGSIVKLGPRLAITCQLVSVSDKTAVASAALKSWNERQDLANAVLKGLEKTAPANLSLLQVDEALMTAWAEALAAVQSGDPAVAKKLVADVAKRWPAFTPAVERLAQL